MEALEAAPFRIEDYAARAPWLQARASGISSTDALVIADETHPFCRETRYSLWARKSGFLPLDDGAPSRFLEWGNRLEPVVHRWAVEETGLAFQRRPYRLLRRRDKAHHVCSPDALYLADRIGLEVKTTGERHADDWFDHDGNPVVPVHYLVQVQHQMLVTGWDRWAVAVLIGGNDPLLVVVQRDERFVAALEHAIDEFWLRVLEGRPPPMLGRDPPERSILRALWPAATPGTRVQLPPEALELHEERVLGKRLQDRGAAMETRAKLKLEQLLGAAEEGVLPGVGVYRLRNAKRVGYQPAYVQPWTGRRLTFKGSEEA